MRIIEKKDRYIIQIKNESETDRTITIDDLIINFSTDKKLCSVEFLKNGWEKWMVKEWWSDTQIYFSDKNHLNKKYFMIDWYSEHQDAYILFGERKGEETKEEIDILSDALKEIITDDKPQQKVPNKSTSKKCCLNCRNCDLGGVEEIDDFVHCSKKHLQSITKGVSERQHEITEEEAHAETTCKMFERSLFDNSELYEMTEEEKEEIVKQVQEYQQVFFDILQQEAEKRNISIQSTTSPIEAYITHYVDDENVKAVVIAICDNEKKKFIMGRTFFTDKFRNLEILSDHITKFFIKNNIKNVHEYENPIHINDLYCKNCGKIHYIYPEEYNNG